MNPKLPPPVTVTDELMFIMMLVQRKLARPSQNMARHAMSPTQFQAMGTLAYGGPQSMTALADEIMVSKQQLTPVIDKLVEAGYVSRTSDPADRRVTMLALSPSGHDFLGMMKKEFEAMVLEKLSVLSPETTGELRAALRTVGAILGQLP